MFIQRCCLLSPAGRVVIVLFLSLMLSTFLVLGFSGHKQLSRYEIELVFDSPLPSLPAHALKLEHSPSFGKFRNEFAVYNFTAVEDDVLRFDFETLSESISSLRLMRSNALSPEIPKLPGLFKIRSGGTDVDFRIIDSGVDGNGYRLGTEFRLSQPLTPVSTKIQSNKGELGSKIILFFCSVLLLFLFFIWLWGFSKGLKKYTVRRSFVILTFILYVFNIVLVGFFTRDFDNQYQILLSNSILCAFEWLVLSFFVISVDKLLFQSLITIFCSILILAQFMCLELSCSYISPVSLGNINLDNLDILFNKYNWKYPALAVLFILFVIFSRGSKQYSITLGNMSGLISRLIFVISVIGVFFVNVLPNGSRIDSFQSPLVGIAKTGLNAIFPEQIGSLFSLISSSRLKEYEEPCFASFASFCNATAYDSPLPFETVIEPKSPNLILIFAESLTAEFIDSYRNRPLGVMPFTSKVHLSKAGNARVTLVRNYFNHSATTLRNIRGQLISGFQRGSLPGRDEADLSSMVKLMENDGYISYFLTGEKSLTFESLLHTVGFRYILSPNQNSIDDIPLNLNKCSGGSECSDLELMDRLKAIVEFHKKTYEKASKPFFISIYNYGTHLNHDGEIKFMEGNNIILNRYFTLDHALKKIITYYSQNLSSDTIMILTADHSIIPGDRGSYVIDFDQRYIVNQVPFYIFQPFYDMPIEYDLKNTNGYMNSLAAAPTTLHLLGINKSNCFLGCSIFEQHCNRAVDLSHYGWYMDSGFFFERGNYENRKAYSPVVIDGKLQDIHKDIDFSLINQYRNNYLNLFD